MEKLQLIKKLKKEQQAITLIALIITIIVLLILAGVAISALGGNDGLLAKVEKAKIEQMKAEAKENIELAIIDIQTQEIYKGTDVTLQTLKDKLNVVDNRIEPKDYTLGDTELNGVYTVNKNTKLDFKIDEKLNVIIGEETEEEKTFPITVTEVETTSLRVTGDVSTLQTPIANYTYVAETSASNQIKFENITETSYTVTGLEPGTEYKVYMLAYDNAGNVTKSSVETVTTKIDKEVLKQNIIIKPSTEEWTNKNIQVEVEWGYNNSNAKKEISIDGGTTYKQYTGTFEVEKNTTIIAKMTIEETEVTKELPITNIDKLPPKDFTPTISDLVSSTEFTINANASDEEETEDYGSSGIKEYQYYVYEGETLIDSSEKITSSSWNASGLTVGNTYDIYVEVWDNAGEYKKSEVISYTKLEVYVWEKYTANITNSYSLVVENVSGKLGGGATSKWSVVNNIYSFNNTTGVFNNVTIKSGSELKVGDWYSPSTFVSKISEVFQISKLDTSSPSVGTWFVYNKSATLKQNTTYRKVDELLGYVKSNNPEEYPENGGQGDYWYEKVN